jgi:hypothetical protein
MQVANGKCSFARLAGRIGRGSLSYAAISKPLDRPVGSILRLGAYMGTCAAETTRVAFTLYLDWAACTAAKRRLLRMRPARCAGHRPRREGFDFGGGQGPKWKSAWWPFSDCSCQKAARIQQKLEILRFSIMNQAVWSALLVRRPILSQAVINVVGGRFVNLRCMPARCV